MYRSATAFFLLPTAFFLQFERDYATALLILVIFIMFFCPLTFHSILSFSPNRFFVPRYYWHLRVYS